MVTNLPREAKLKWNEVTLTRNPEERLRLMAEFLSLVPKHKGTEKMRSHVKRQMAQLREEIEKKKRMAKRGSTSSYFIEKAGAAQVTILGPTNVGRSSLLKAVTNSTVEIASWPFATRKPVPGMLPYKDVQIQLVEAPPIIEGSSEGRADGFQILSQVRNADGLIIMVDLTNRPDENFLMIANELENSRILTVEPKGNVEIRRRGYGTNVQFIWEGVLEDCSQEEIINLLKDYKIKSALVRIRGFVTLDLVEDAIYGSAVYRPTLIIANKTDLVSDESVLKSVKKVTKPLEVLGISTKKTQKLAELLGLKLFNLLDLIRVYTKQPGKEVTQDPIVAKKGLTVGDLAKMIHSDFYKKFRYARLWGPSAKFDNERVGLEHKLMDGDIIQFHA